MNPRQKRIVLIMAALVGLVFVAAVIASLRGSDDDPPAAAGTTTSTTAPIPPTSDPTTSTSSTSTSSTSTTGPSTSTTTSSSTTTSTTVSTFPELVLFGDGLGEVTFGTDADTAITEIAAALGEPDEDSGWIPSFSGFGTCPGEQVRGIRWATMWALMTDGETEWRADGIPHFFAYLNSVFYDEDQSLGLLTAEGVGLGDSARDLEDAYGDRLEITFEEWLDTYLFNIDVPAPGRLWGGLTGGDDDDLITSIDGGQGCGE